MQQCYKVNDQYVVQSNYWDSNHRPTACYLLEIGSFKCDNNPVSLTSPAHRLDRDSESKDTATVVGSESLDLGARYMISQQAHQSVFDALSHLLRAMEADVYALPAGKQRPSRRLDGSHVP